MVKVGDIYDNVCCYYGEFHDFYEVVKVSDSGKTVWLRPLDYYRSYGSDNWKVGLLPRPGKYIGEQVMRRKVHKDDVVIVRKYATARPMGEPHWVCNYNYS